MLVAVSEGAKMAAPGGATVPLPDGGEGVRSLRATAHTQGDKSRRECLAVEC